VRVLLTVPHSKCDIKDSLGVHPPPLGLGYIASYIRTFGDHEVMIYDALLARSTDEDFYRVLESFSPNVVGISGTATPSIYDTYHAARLVKRFDSGTYVVVGGAHVTFEDTNALAECPEIDIVVRGEGETIMEALLRAIETKQGLSDVRGITYRRNSQIVRNPDMPHIKDLDSLPFPAFHLIPFEEYRFTFPVPGRGELPAVNMMTSRGCPFNCNFCATPINWGRHVRMRSPENVVSEIELLVEKYGAKVIFFFDDTFNANPKRAEQICDLILERKLDVFWKCDVRMDLINKPLLTKMKKAGLFHLSFGLEAGSERIRNQIINKKVDVGDFHNLVRWCQELGIIPNVFFIFSHPTETWEEAQETIRIIEQYGDRIEASVAILHIYPGTPLEKTAKKTRVLPEDFSWTKKYRTKIITLPTAQGDVPLYKDKLTWAQISELVFRWSLSGGISSIFPKIPRIISNIRSPGDFVRYKVMAWVYLKLKIKRIFVKSG